MKVLVCGGRRDVKVKRIFRVMDDITAIILATTGEWIEVAEGHAIGTDQAAGAWADTKAHAHWRFPINNTLDGHDPLVAPKRRNQRMLDVFQPALCVGFPGHGGTFDMMKRCQGAGVPVWDVEFDDTGFAIVLWRPKQRSLLIHKGKFDEPLDSITVDREHLGYVCA